MNKYESNLSERQSQAAKARQGQLDTRRTGSASSERRPIMATPKCEKCGGRTYLSRREPDPVRGPEHELHTFRCASCEHCQPGDADMSAEE
jgi:hypothetical protein